MYDVLSVDFSQYLLVFLEFQFFPKSEKYISLFMGGHDVDIVDKRNRLRKQIKANLLAAAASGKDLEGSPQCLTPFLSMFGIIIHFMRNFK